MGGLGSTRWRGHRKRTLVEDCLRLDIQELARQGFLDEDLGAVVAEWHGPDTTEPLDRVFLAQQKTAKGRVVLLATLGATQVVQGFRLVAKPCNFGGQRWYAKCSGFSGRPCGRRVARFYRPPGGLVYACRDCHGLTYLSTQAEDKRVYAIRRQLRHDPELALQLPANPLGLPLPLFIKLFRSTRKMFLAACPSPSDAELRLQRISLSAAA